MSQKLPVNNLEWTEEISQFNENFIKNYNGESDEGYYIEIDVQYPQNLHELHIFIRKIKNLKSRKACY